MGNNNPNEKENAMHQTHDWTCPRCEETVDLDFTLRKSHMKCPEADKWREVIESKLPRCKTLERADEVRKILNEVGLVSNCHYGSEAEGYVISVNVITDAFKNLMKHERVDGALYHKPHHNIICPKCVLAMRKEKYDESDKVPDITCPTCEAVLVPLEAD